jgi:hypothetical protein
MSYPTKKLFYLLIMIPFLFFSCGKTIYVHDVQSGRKVDRAHEIDVNHFFSLRMENKLRKINVGNWDILLETDEYVYIGKPRVKNLFSEKRIIDTLYKIRTPDLRTQLPKFKDVEGFKIKQQCREIIFDEKKSQNEITNFFLTDYFKTHFEKQTISITVQAQTDTLGEKYTITLDSKTLEKIQLKKL